MTSLERLAAMPWHVGIRIGQQSAIRVVSEWRDVERLIGGVLPAIPEAYRVPCAQSFRAYNPNPGGCAWVFCDAPQSFRFIAQRLPA